jgi:hypothetical protein
VHERERLLRFISKKSGRGFEDVAAGALVAERTAGTVVRERATALLEGAADCLQIVDPSYGRTTVFVGTYGDPVGEGMRL